jgi:hypothetical protein
VRSLEDNDLDEQAKQALRNAWRGAPSHLELQEEVNKTRDELRAVPEALLAL